MVKKCIYLMVIGIFLFLQGCGVLFYRDRDLKEYQTHKEQYEPYKYKNTIKGYREFIAKYPENIFMREAKLEIENLEIAPYETMNSVEAYMEFKIRYPNNRHVSMANVKIEQVELKRYEKMDTIEGYREFLSKYPKSNFAILAGERLQELEYRKNAEKLRENYSFDLLKYRLNLKRLKKKLQEGDSSEFSNFTHQVSTKHYSEKDYFHTSLIYSIDLISNSDSPEEIGERFFKTVIKELLYYLNQDFTQMNKIDGFSFSIAYSPEQILDTVDQKESLMEFYYPSQLVKNLSLQQISDQECLEQSIIVLKDKIQAEEEVASLSPAESKKVFDIESIPEERRGYEIMAKFYETPVAYDGIDTSITRMIDKNGKEKKSKTLRKWKQYNGEKGVDQKFIIIFNTPLLAAG